MQTSDSLPQVASFCVDSGQFVITSPSRAKLLHEANDSGEVPYIDKRIPVHIPSGAGIDPKYLCNWEARIPEHNASLNQLNARGQLRIDTAPLAVDMSYQACSDTTLYTNRCAGFIDEDKGFASATAFGDGEFPVYLHEDDQGVTIDTCCSEFCIPIYDVRLERFEGLLDLSEGKIVIQDPCYGDLHLAAVIDVPPGHYSVHIAWPKGESAMTMRHGYVILRKENAGKRETNMAKETHGA